MSHSINYQLNVTEFAERRIRKVYQPANLDELRDLLKVAVNNQESLYSISTGHNWGLGSKLPVQDASVVDLSGLNEILELNRELRYVRVQPGVTQMQLFQYLHSHAPELMLNVTGADSRSSIIGNIMDRGSGKNGHRADDLRELKVMLTDGRVISSGYGGNPEAQESFYRYGTGPDLTHLFTQSNYGVVTEAVVNLMIKQSFNLYLVTFEKSMLDVFLSSMSELIGLGIVGHTLEIDSQNDPKIFELFEGVNSEGDQWFAWFTIYGADNLLVAKDELLRKSILPVIDQIQSFHSETTHQDIPLPVDVRLKRYKGEPSDHSLVATARRFGVNLKHDQVNIDCHKEIPGFRCVLPVVPLSRRGAEIIDFIIMFTKSFGLDPSLSIIGLNEFSLEVFVRVYFDRNEEKQIEQAGFWASELLNALKERGIFPYRLDIDNMQPYLQNLEDPAWDVRADIKRLLDPSNILSPGRYNIY